MLEAGDRVVRNTESQYYVGDGSDAGAVGTVVGEPADAGLIPRMTSASAAMAVGSPVVWIQWPGEAHPLWGLEESYLPAEDG